MLPLLPAMQCYTMQCNAMQMMEILSNEKFSDIITWLPHGRGFVILQKKRFANEIMPKFFNKKSKFTSFTRKLNRWYVTS
jgi:HSF-type DNA-binding